jgi:hypothetical protein
MRALLSMLLLAALPSVVLAQSKVNFIADGFDDNHNRWMEANTAEYRFQITEGHLAIDANSVSVHNYQNILAAAEDTYAIHTRMIFLNGTSEGWMGLRFNMSEDATRYLTFSYNNAQGFLVTNNSGKKHEVLRESKSVVIKPYDYNTLTIVKKEKSYQFLINDKQVFQDDIKSFYGSMAGVYVSKNMSIKVDEFQVYDVRRGRQKIVSSQVTMAKASDSDVKQIIAQQSSMSDDFRTFYDAFFKAAFPYEYSTVIKYSKNINHIPFVQKTFFEFDLSTMRYHNVHAMTILSACQGGYTFLIAEEYGPTSIQDVIKFVIVAYDNQGNLLGRKDVGSEVKENGKYFQTLDFRVTQSGSSIVFNVQETYYTGNVNKRLVSFNGDICNLNSY